MIEFTVPVPIPSSEYEAANAAFVASIADVPPEDTATIAQKRSEAVNGIWQKWFIGTDGRPSKDPLVFKLRTPTMMDGHNINRRVREHAAKLQNEGTEDPLAYADYIAGQKMLGNLLRAEIERAIGSFKPEDQELRQRAVSFLINMLEELLSGQGDATLRELAKVDEKLAVFATPYVSSIEQADRKSKRLWLSYLTELTYLNATLQSIERIAKWEVCCEMAPEWRVLDRCPAWEAYGKLILDAWAKQEEASLQVFMTPSVS